jgi:hypothetical protein
MWKGKTIKVLEEKLDDHIYDTGSGKDLKTVHKSIMKQNSVFIKLRTSRILKYMCTEYKKKF